MFFGSEQNRFERYPSKVSCKDFGKFGFLNGKAMKIAEKEIPRAK